MRPAGRFLSLFAARPCPKKYFQELSKKRRLAGSKGPVWCHVGGKGQNHHIPHGKGVRRWKLSPATMANSAGLMLSAKPYCEMRPRNYHRDMKRQRDRETSFSVLPQAELDKLYTVDHYPSDDFVFSSHGYDLHIDNELVAAAFAELPQQAQSILILHCVLELADGEIGALMGMSRSAVQRHRTKTLKELRTKLMALMPEGG